MTFIGEMMSRPQRKDSEDIEKLMEAETKKGYQSTPAKKAEMDKKGGIGKWRTRPLFINGESGGKQRLIANAKGGGHNAWTSDEETLFVIAVCRLRSRRRPHDHRGVHQTPLPFGRHQLADGEALRGDAELGPVRPRMR